MGVPAVFLRLAGCNMRCDGFSYQHPESGEHLGCDTKAVWMTGDKYDFAAILTYWRQQGWLQSLHQGAHLVITGGEPLIQQQGLLRFIPLLRQHVPNCFVEMETNGSIMPEAALLPMIQQYNVSPKLPFSGESKQRAYLPEVLSVLQSTQQAYFKFVVRNEQDVQIVEQDYVQALSLIRSRIMLMPEGATRQALKQREHRIVALCMRYGYRFCPRLHIYLWDEATGV